MKKISMVFIAYFCIFFITAFDIVQAQWQGNIESEEGIKVIHNPREPLYGKIQFELEEDLTISSEQQNDDYMFYRVKGMTVDSEDNILFIDLSNFRILVFDKKGTPVRSIGRQGQGPGDLETPYAMRLNPSTEDIYVNDRFRTIDIFKKNGDPEDMITTKLFIEDLFPLDDGTILTQVRRTSDAELKSEQILCRINDKGEVINTIAEFPYPTLMRRTNTGATFSTSTGFELSVYMAVLDSEKWIYGYSKSYELVVTDREGKQLYIIRKDSPKPKFTSEEQSYYKKIDFPVPEFKPYFYLILTDSKGRIYVETNKAEDGIRGYGPIDTTPKEVDIFSSDGYYLYKAILPSNTTVIKNGYLYTFDFDEETVVESIRRFKIKNWDQIKAVK